MARKPSLTHDDDAPELTDAELAQMRPARDIMTAEEFAAVTSVRGSLQSPEPKVSVTLQLSRSVIEAYKATGEGWQARINDMLAGSLGSVLGKARDGSTVDHGPIPVDGKAGKKRA